MRIKKIVMGTIGFILLFAQMPALGLPALGSSNMKNPPANAATLQVVSQGFEQLIGRPLDHNERQQMNAAVHQLEITDDQPQRANFVGDLISRYDLLPIVCMYGKVNGKLPSIFGTALAGANASYEITPCLVMNSFNPFALRVSEFKSYIMQGGSFLQAEGSYGGVAGGFTAGIYAGPKSLAHPLIGTYGLFRLTADKKLAKLVGQVAYSNLGQVLAMAGVGGEVSIESVLHILDILPKAESTSVSVAGVKGEFGLYFNVKEFPWFERLFVQRMDPVTALSDFNQYLAAAN